MRASRAVGGGSFAGAVAEVALRRTRMPAGPIAALVFVALAWGGAFSVIKDTLATISPAGLVTWRFAIAAAVLLLIRPRSLAHLRTRTAVRGAGLGLLLGAGFLLHTWGMQSTSVVVSAFITGTVVVFAPLVARIWLRRRLGRRSAFAILLATAGLAVITVRGAAFGWGELLIGLAALLWAVHLVALERWTAPDEVYPTALIQLSVVAGLGAVVEVATAGRVAVPTAPSELWALCGLGAVATAAAFVALTWAQTRTDATTSAVVLTLEPVFGAATAVVLGESLSMPVALGAVAVIIAACVVARPQPQLVLAA
ncbi:MAG: DMT family transporter [Propionibacteriaceae bacterium]